MAKIDRFNGNVKAFASEALSTERTVFGDTVQSDTLDANINLDLLRGWGIVDVNENPTKQDFNGLAFTLGQLIAYLHQRGVPEWNSAQEYYQGSVVTTLAGIYRLKTGGDGSVDPDIDGGVNWTSISAAASEAVAGQAEIATQTETNTGNDDLRFVTPKKLRFGFSISLTQSGYIAFPSFLGGLIVQWKFATLASSGDTAVTLPIVFPNAAHAGAAILANGPAYVDLSSGILTTSTLTVYRSAPASFLMIAFGS